jgi:hypothetical protein
MTDNKINIETKQEKNKRYYENYKKTHQNLIYNCKICNRKYKSIYAYCNHMKHSCYIKITRSDIKNNKIIITSSYFRSIFFNNTF